MDLQKYFRDHNREMSLVIAIFIMIIVFSLINNIYFSWDNITDIIEQATIYGLMAIGMSFIIISGGIDLSVGSALALICVIVAKFSIAQVHPVVCVILGLTLGFILGIVNGILVSKMKLQPFIATLGTMSIYRGIAYIVSGGLPVINIPNEFRNLVNGQIIDNYLRVSIVFFLFLAVLFHIILSRTRLGIYTYAIGGNEECARLSGVKVDFNKVIIYGVGMVGTALAAIIYVGKLGSGEPTAGQGYELNAIAAVAIGGTSMAGGRGGIVGTVLGAILFSGLKVGLIVVGVDTFWQYIATGLVIILAAYIEILQSSIDAASIERRIVGMHRKQ